MTAALIPLVYLKPFFLTLLEICILMRNFTLVVAFLFHTTRSCCGLLMSKSKTARFSSCSILSCYKTVSSNGKPCYVDQFMERLVIDHICGNERCHNVQESKTLAPDNCLYQLSCTMESFGPRLTHFPTTWSNTRIDVPSRGSSWKQVLLYSNAMATDLCVLRGIADSLHEGCNWWWKIIDSLIAEGWGEVVRKQTARNK